MPDLAPSNPNPATTVTPDFTGLVKFLVEPFLEAPERLKVDCELSPRTARVLIRVAFEGEDKGRVFGRGGRNIQAIRAAVQAVAQTAGYVAHLEVYGSQPAREGGHDKPPPSRPQSRNRVKPRPH